MSKRYYRHKAIPTEHRGIIYASKLEARMAKLLWDNHIKFEYSKRFFTNRGNGHYREVDFFLKKHIEVCWCDTKINAIETKGVLTREAYIQKKDLRDIGIATFTATSDIVLFWERYAFLKRHFVELNY